MIGGESRNKIRMDPKRYIAFLRAVNVGGRVVKMEALRAIFVALGFSNVETFIASGNVIFETAERDASALEARIAKELKGELGYEVAVFLRTDAELSALAKYQPFDKPVVERAAAFNVAFLAAPPGDAAKKRLMALKTEIDDFRVHGREVYWLCREKQSKSTFSNAALEKASGMQSTLRGMNTVKKLAEKYPVM
ncbi:MAG: DUF1697 domain-containing protein [Chloroflexi bacterium]|nr:DUF1697 domain-containing protein [Chloroflexota bacterium]